MKDDQKHTLFKFRGLSDRRGRFAIEKALIESELHWQRPSGFNDPFDCRPFYFFGKSERERDRYIRDLVDRRMEGSSRAERRAKRRNLPPWTQDTIRETAERIVDQTAVTCFSLENNHPLMWAHYASSHSGLCFQFEERIDDFFFSYPVEYKETRPEIDMIELSARANGTLEKILFTKDIAWKYECERRMFMRAEPGFKPFPAASLVGLIFGARISDKDRAFVMELLSRREAPIALYQAEADVREYRINVHPLT